MPTLEFASPFKGWSFAVRPDSPKQHHIFAAIGTLIYATMGFLELSQIDKAFLFGTMYLVLAVCHHFESRR